MGVSTVVGEWFRNGRRLRRVFVCSIHLPTPEPPMSSLNVRIRAAATVLALGTAMTFPGVSVSRAADDFADVKKEIAARHDEAVKRLRDWIALPSIAAESLNSAAGAEY